MRRAFATGRTRTLSFACLLAFVGYANPVGYRHTYRTAAERLEFARTFGANRTIQLFYGTPHSLLTVGGYTAWRTGSVAAIASSVWALLAIVRATRAEEDAGRQDLVLAEAVGRRRVFASAVLASLLGAGTIWLVLELALIGARLPVAGSAYLALASVAPAVAFLGVGACAAQLAPSRRRALELGVGVLLIAYAMRIAADTVGGLRWLSWLTPLGWSENAQAFASPAPWTLLLPFCLGAALLVGAAEIAARRDVGRGVLAEANDSTPPRTRWLRSPATLALHGELGTVTAWLVASCLFAFVIGLLSTTFTTQTIPVSLRRTIHRLGGAVLTTPAGALGFYFLFFVFAASIFACTQIGAVRREEAEHELAAMLALPVSRSRWLGARLLLASFLTVCLALAIGVAAWVGAASRGADVPFGRMLEAGVNCLPAALLFLGIAALAFALIPRAASVVSYSVVAAAFLWQLLGDVLGAPHALTTLTPFAHVALVPAEAMRPVSAVAMAVIALAASVAAVAAFSLRDVDAA